ncbi:MAG: argininosuccinate lyase [Candidatus Hydrogenedentes bacterium]|nr:argininosuccinate lyase [Candidatus Hydrogenedentota bacterium]
MRMKKLWGGRFEGATDKLVESFSESVSFDARLAPWDIRGSIAHARMLGAQGIIRAADAKKIIAGLKVIAKEIEDGTFVFDPALEDVHMNIESALTERIGDAGKRLHTGRSRNDQVALDVRLWTRDQVDAVGDELRDLQRALADFAEAHMDVILPGMTHLQHAQPVLLAHHYLAYFEMFGRDRERFAELRKRVNVLPLGSAALAGTTYPIDRDQVAKELGFDAVSRNSMDAVSDRDYLIEFCSAASIAMMHLSRLSEELVLWSSSAFGYVEIGDAFTTGSSIMPQKKNPDVAELVRGKVGRVYGDLTALLTLMKGLPLTYNRDMQEDKEPVFDAADTLRVCLRVVARMIPSIRVNRKRMAAAASEGFLEATDVADYLVGKGLPFREAHEITGKLVLYCAKNQRRLPELSLDEFRSFSGLFGSDLRAQLTPQSIVSRRNTFGGTAPSRVRHALRQARRALK